MKVRRLSVLVLGERDQPVHPPISVPALVLDDLEALLTVARERGAPDLTYEGLIRAICTYGIRSVTHSLKSGLTLRADGTIPAAAAKAQGRAGKAAQSAALLKKQQEGGVD